MPNVLITARYFAVDPEPLEVLRAHGCTLVHTDLDWTLGDGNVPAARTVELLRDVAGAIIASLPLTESVLAQAPALKVMALWYSPGCKIIVLSTVYVNISTFQHPEKRV